MKLYMYLVNAKTLLCLTLSDLERSNVSLTIDLTLAHTVKLNQNHCC